MPTVKHGGGSVMVWGSMSAQGIGDLHFIDGIMNAEMYSTIVQEKMLPSLRRLGRGAMFQHDNDLKHTVKVTGRFPAAKEGEGNRLAQQACHQTLTPLNTFGVF